MIRPRFKSVNPDRDSHNSKPSLIVKNYRGNK